MIKKAARFLFAFVAITVYLASAGPAIAEETDADAVYLQDGDTGDYVIQVQYRLKDLGYFNYKITNYYGSYTTETVREFQEVNGLSADGVLGPETAALLFSNEAIRKPVEEVVEPTTTTTTTSVSVPTGTLRDWFTYVYPRFSRGETVKVYDVDTGITYNMVRVGGSNHADVEPATASDCEKFLETYGGEWSWDRRAVVVVLDGEYIAGSINGYPHGYETISGNGMEGQVCIHFLNSRTHINDAVCPIHQAMVYKAAGQG